MTLSSKEIQEFIRENPLDKPIGYTFRCHSFYGLCVAYRILHEKGARENPNTYKTYIEPGSDGQSIFHHITISPVFAEGYIITDTDISLAEEGYDGFVKTYKENHGNTFVERNDAEIAADKEMLKLSF